MYAKNAEFKVGIVVVLGSLALLALLFWATGGGFWKEWRHIPLRVEPGDLAPQKGDPVYMNGVEIGQVQQPTFRYETRRDQDLTDRDLALLQADAERAGVPVAQEVREIFVHVTAKLRQDVVLPVGTKGVISESITGSRRLELVPGHSLEDLTDEALSATPMLVYQSPTIDALGEKVGALIDQATNTVAAAESTILEVKDAVARVKAQVLEGALESIVEDVRAGAGSIKRTLAAVEERIDVLSADLYMVVADVKGVAASALRIASGLETDLPELVSEVRTLVDRVDGVVEKAAPKVDQFLDAMARTGENLVTLSTDLSGIGDEAGAVVSALGSDLGELASVLVDTGRNLLDASEDLKAHPWKLLNEPSVDEIAYENLRATMVNYVRAMQRMEETSSTLNTLLARGDVSNPTVRALLQRTLAEFERSVDRYRSSESRLMQILRATAPGGRGTSPRLPAEPPVRAVPSGGR